MAARGRPEPMDAEQQRLLKEAKHMVTVQAFQMKRALDQSPPNLMEALKHASNLINELRTGLLSPRAYEELYRLCFDQLRHLELFLSDQHQRGQSLLDLYELVQYAGNILPRLYLLITVGAVYIRSLEAPANDVLYDLVELCRGVQHPTRGLFLRNYLSEMTKDTLPDDGSNYAGSVTDSIDFIVANFTEMNKLWVRMQHGAGPIRSPEQRERERTELSLLIGKNLQRLSQLDGLTLGIYKSDVLPRILTQVVQCRDRLAQQYLLDIIIQVFSDEFHLHTLDQILTACLQLNDDVDVPSIIATLIERLARYCETNASAIPEDLDMFARFTEYTNKLSAERSSDKLGLAAIVSLDSALINLALKVYNGDAQKLDSVYDAASEHILRRGFTARTGRGGDDKAGINAVLNLLRAPLQHFKSVRPTLSLDNYGKVVATLPFEHRKRFAGELIENLLQNETEVPSPGEVDVLFKYLAPLVVIDNTEDQALSADDWEEDQTRVAFAISMLRSAEIDEQFAIILKAHEHVANGGPNRVKYSLPPLIFKAMQLVQRVYATQDTQDRVDNDEDAPWLKKAKRIFKFVNDAVTQLKSAGETQLSFRLYLEAALSAGKCQMKNFAYGFLTKGAIAIYEEDATSQSTTEYDSIRLLITTVNALDCFDEESYSFLAQRLAQHSSKLLNLDDQSRAVEMSAHLFRASIDGGKNKYVANDRILSCLKKAMNVAGNIHEADIMIELLVDLLDRFLYFYANVPDSVDVVYINAIIKKIHKHFTISSLPATHPALQHFAQVKRHVQVKQWKDIEF